MPTNPTRRSFTSGAALSATALALPIGGKAKANPTRPNTDSPSAVDVVVVGGGLAGLTAARRLRTSGLSVLALEAKDRIGGRVESVRLPNGIVGDLGAQWIRPDQTFARDLASEARAALHETSHTGTKLAVLDGEARDVGADGLPMGPLSSLDAWRVTSKLERLSRLGGDLPERWRAATVDDFLRSVTWSERGRRLMDFALRNDLCLPTDSVALHHLVQQLSTMGGARAALQGGEGEIVTHGATSLVRHLAKGLPNAIMTDTPVAAIEQDIRSVRVHHRRGTVVAEHVVLAIPPQLYADIAFDPLPPDDKVAFWAGHMPGEVIKTLIAYDEPWWRDRGLSGTLIGPDEAFPFICDSGGSEGGGLLVGLSTAGAAAKLRRHPELRTPDGFKRWLSAVTGSDVPTPVAVVSRDWGGDPYQRGGYASLRPMGAWPDEPFAAFGRMHFAGTETASSWQSYMSGAVQSGERAAFEVLSAATAKLARQTD